MKKDITITVDDKYLPILYGLLNKELKAAQELANDEKFAKAFPHLTKRALLTVRNLTPILDKLGEEF